MADITRAMEQDEFAQLTIVQHKGTLYVTEVNLHRDSI